MHPTQNPANTYAQAKNDEGNPPSVLVQKNGDRDSEGGGGVIAGKRPIGKMARQRAGAIYQVRTGNGKKIFQEFADQPGDKSANNGVDNLFPFFLNPQDGEQSEEKKDSIDRKKDY